MHLLLAILLLIHPIYHPVHHYARQASSTCWNSPQLVAENELYNGPVKLYPPEGTYTWSSAVNHLQDSSVTVSWTGPLENDHKTIEAGQGLSWNLPDVSYVEVQQDTQEQDPGTGVEVFLTYCY